MFANRRLSLAFLIALNLSACDQAADEPTDDSASRVVQIEDWQAAFDLSTPEEHGRMIQMMKGYSPKLPGDSRYLSLSLFEARSGRHLDTVQTEYTITRPDGSSFVAIGQELSGGGMHHLIAEIARATPGRYSIEARLRVDNITRTTRVVLTSQ